MNASILAIGTELTSGQIVNRNCAWISEQCEKSGVTVVQHLTVPDEWADMKRGLDQCSEVADIVILTGGLGPTSDDFTRDVVGEWTALPMEYDPESMTHIEERMRQFGRKVLESQKRQCFYPKGSRVLKNNAGTANGFYVVSQKKHIFVLPGPPKEVASIWNDHVHGTLKELVPSEERVELFKWDCMGKAEAELAEMVEKVVKDQPVKTGYRLHAPYVEVKIWCKKAKTHASLIQKVEDTLRPWLVGKNGEDVARHLLEMLPKNKKCEFWEIGTKGFLSERITPFIRDGVLENAKLVTDWEGSLETSEDIQTFFDTIRTEGVILGLVHAPVDQKWFATLKMDADFRVQELPAIEHRSSFNEKGMLTAVEHALRFWTEILRGT